MRIISGRYKGRVIKMPRGTKIRPTSDRVKEALFQVIGTRVEGAIVLDHFSGSGSLGIEALSRGARSVTFVDNEIACIDIIKENLKRLGVDSPFGTRFDLPVSRYSLQILKSDGLSAIRKFGEHKRKFDIILSDPPYYKDLARKSLIKIAKCDILKIYGLLVIEHSKRDLLLERDCERSPAVVVSLIRRYRYGDTIISFYTRSS